MVQVFIIIFIVFSISLSKNAPLSSLPRLAISSNTPSSLPSPSFKLTGQATRWYGKGYAIRYYKKKFFLFLFLVFGLCLSFWSMKKHLRQLPVEICIYYTCYRKNARGKKKKTKKMMLMKEWRRKNRRHVCAGGS